MLWALAFYDRVSKKSSEIEQQPENERRYCDAEQGGIAALAENTTIDSKRAADEINHAVFTEAVKKSRDARQQSRKIPLALQKKRAESMH